MAELVKSFSVVEFPCDEDGSSEIEVVPYLWLKEDNSKCYWPNIKSSERLRKMVGNVAIPNETWRTCEVLRVFGTYKTLLEARNKAKRAVDTSDINTDSEKRRRQIPKRFNVEQSGKVKNLTKKFKTIADESSDSDRSESDSVKSPPKFPSVPVACQNSSNAKNITTGRSSSSSKTFGPTGMLTLSGPMQILSQNAEQDRNSQFGVQTSSDSTGPIQSLTSFHSPRTSSVASHSNDAWTNFGANGSGSERNFSPVHEEQHRSTFDRKISADLFGIKARLTQIESTMNLILAQLSKLSEPSHHNPLALKLPSSSLEEMKLLDMELREQEVQIQMIQFCKTLGGSSAADMTRRILRKIMTDAVASQINWRGHNGKLSFEKTKMSELIIAGVQAFYGPGDTKGNAKIVEQATKEWLKQASNRMKQSQQRTGLGQAQLREGNSDNSGSE